MVISFGGNCTELLLALSTIQREMKPILKDALLDTPKFKAKYATLNRVLETVIPILEKQGILLLQAPGGSKDGAEVETTLVHLATGARMRSVAFTPTKEDPQGVGSAITYLRRYSLVTLLSIPVEDDDGARGSGVKARTSRNPAADAVEGQRVPNDTIRDLLRRAGIADSEHKSWLQEHVGMGAALTPQQSQDAARLINAMITQNSTAMTLQQRGMLNALMTKAGITGEDRHEFFGRLTGKRSSGEFTKVDAKTVIDYLYKTYPELRHEENSV